MRNGKADSLSQRRRHRVPADHRQQLCRGGLSLSDDGVLKIDVGANIEIGKDGKLNSVMTGKSGWVLLESNGYFDSYKNEDIGMGCIIQVGYSSTTGNQTIQIAKTRDTFYVVSVSADNTVTIETIKKGVTSISLRRGTYHNPIFYILA